MNGAETTIGRLKKNNAIVNSKAVSGAHAVLLSDGIKDIGSSNGTYLYLNNGSTQGSSQSKTFDVPSKDSKIIVGHLAITINPAAE